MKRFSYSLISILLLIGLNGCSSDENSNQASESKKSQKLPLKIVLDSLSLGSTEVPLIRITSLEDKLTIKSVIVNKGHCSKLSNGHNIKQVFPRTFQFSQKLVLELSPYCDVIRIDIETNSGNWSVEY